MPAQVTYATDLSLDAEKNLLLTLFEEYQSAGAGSLIIGHNHVWFDLPFILKRAIVHGVTPPPFFPRNPRWNTSDVYDTMIGWAGRDFVSMNTLCKILGIEGKGDIDGSMVWPMVQAGKVAEVAEYCKGDVERTREIFKRLTFGQL